MKFHKTVGWMRTITFMNTLFLRCLAFFHTLPFSVGQRPNVRMINRQTKIVTDNMLKPVTFHTAQIQRRLSNRLS